MKLVEISFLMESDAAGVIVHEGGEARLEQLREWFSTPVGTVYGNPSWGHPLNQYRHEPELSAPAIENSILLKLPLDLPEIPVTSILCEPAEKDLFHITIGTPFGMHSNRVNL
ncbi:hypothetical protein L4174_023790 (plasmid) [Photobacterium sp. CCB-ST2H9]|uniref:hypothetical protein n=1 Tax=Photobacterium sp. CCB-ST2H9 TaxID=2912855 RepID=UPI0020031E65|nr:hypothetical protein [Photobacterium sp. CCB-ST2H9]UTM60491.1 hypothetical protein L4174_023790 [Photobacterium sp. CCB-ST2H9]